uniref:Uncharacterized protein n=1 Tax=Neobodo designis TaxID=312471 RepID=A0A7S1QMR5_NEODS
MADAPPINESDRQALISLLEMLNLQQYIGELVTPPAGSKRADAAAGTNAASIASCGAPQTVASIAELEKYPTAWQRIIKKRHHRDILGGYLSVRKAKQHQQQQQQAAKCEARLGTFFVHLTCEFEGM